MELFLDTKLKTTNCIDKLALMIFFMPILEAKSENRAAKAIERLKSFLYEKFKRGITLKEEISLLEGCRNYLMSDPGTNERAKSMNYLFGLKFMNDSTMADTDKNNFKVPTADTDKNNFMDRQQK